jgi:hypothetical protein
MANLMKITKDHFYNHQAIHYNLILNFVIWTSLKVLNQIEISQF